MGMGEAVGLFFKNYVNFNGRARRSEYWWVILALVLFFTVAALLLFGLGGFNPDNPSGMNAIGMGLAAIFGLAYLAVLLPGISLAVRRWHDLGQTGWLYLVFLLLGFVPVVGFLASIGNLIWFCMPGTVGPNQYGPDPKGGHDVDVFS